jgi:hypothetical protein
MGDTNAKHADIPTPWEEIARLREENARLRSDHALMTDLLDNEAKLRREAQVEADNAAESARMAEDRVARLVEGNLALKVKVENLELLKYNLIPSVTEFELSRYKGYYAQACEERDAARNHAEVWMHKVEDIRVDVGQLTAERDALAAHAERIDGDNTVLRDANSGLQVMLEASKASNDRLAKALKQIAAEKATMSYPRNVLYELNEGRRIAREALREREEGE